MWASFSPQGEGMTIFLTIILIVPYPAPQGEGTVDALILNLMAVRDGGDGGNPESGIPIPLLTSPLKGRNVSGRRLCLISNFFASLPAAYFTPSRSVRRSRLSL